MDKYKTSEMGKALKSVFRGELSVDASVEMAKREIAQYFAATEPLPIEEDQDVGFFGDVIGACPLCGSPVKRYKVSYGCSGYKEGCQFHLNLYICGRAISVSNARRLLETGSTAKIKGFISKKGTPFDAILRREGDRCVFSFDDEPKSEKTEGEKR